MSDDGEVADLDGNPVKRGARCLVAYDGKHGVDRHDAAKRE